MTLIGSIPAEQALEMIYSETYIASQLVSKHRWYTKQLIVFDHEYGEAGFYYLEPATEEQEGQDRFEADPVPVFAVTSKIVREIVYSPAV